VLQHSHTANPHEEQEVLECIEEVYYNSGEIDTSEYELKVCPFWYL